MSDYHKLLLLSLFDMFGSRQRGTKRLLTACHTHRLDAETEIPEKSRVTSKCQRRFFSCFDTELMKSAAEDFGSAVNEAVKGLLSNTMKSADTKTQHRQEKLRLMTFAAVHLVPTEGAVILSVSISGCVSKKSPAQVVIKHLWEPGGVTLGLERCVCLYIQGSFCYGINTLMSSQQFIISSDCNF